MVVVPAVAWKRGWGGYALIPLPLLVIGYFLAHLSPPPFYLATWFQAAGIGGPLIMAVVGRKKFLELTGSMRLLWKSLVILVFAAVIAVGVLWILLSVGCRQEFNPNNTSVDLPEDVGYAQARDRIAVIDLASYEVVGLHKISTTDEHVGGFAVGPDGNLYCSITSQAGTGGKIIRVISAATGQIVDEIEVGWRPRGIYALPGGKAIVEHSGTLDVGEGYPCEVLDMNSGTVVRTFYFQGPAAGVLRSPEGRVYIVIFNMVPGFPPYNSLIEFDPQTNDLVGNPIILDSKAEYLAFATDSKLYACNLGGEEEDKTSLGVIEFPSGNLVKVTVPASPRHILLIGEKAYIIHFNGNYGAAEDQRLVSIIDVNTDQVVKTLEVSPGPRHLAYSESTGKIYVACVDGKISVIDTATDTVVGTAVCEDVWSWGFKRIVCA